MISLIGCETRSSQNTITYEINFNNWYFKANGWSISKLDIEMKLTHTFLYVV